MAHSRLILNNNITYLYNYKLPLMDEEPQIKIETDDLAYNLIDVEAEAAVEEETIIKSEPIDYGYEGESGEYNSELVIKREENEFVSDTFHSASESESSMANKESVEDPDVTTDDFSTESDDSSSSNDSEASESFSDDDESDDDVLTKRFQCPYCEISVRKLDEHVQRAHSNCAKNINKTICGLCSVKFKLKKKLKDQQSQVHGGNSYACDLCDYMTNVYNKIQGHIIRIHLKENHFLCDICGKDYKFFKYLTRHIHSRHSGMRVQKHVCDMCDKKYFHPQSLRTHIRSIHFNERPFQCNVDGCNKAFRQRTALATHKQVHMKRNLFPCIICDKKFTFKWNLRTHIKNIHGT